MKAGKENCRIYTDDYYKTCEMWFDLNYYSDDVLPRVILVPKVCRVDGNQYKVIHFDAPVIPYKQGHTTTIKAPRGCDVKLYSSNCVVEYYD